MASSGDLQDVRNSLAFARLLELEQQGIITHSQAEHQRTVYSRLHDGVLATYENEKSLLAKAKELHNQLSTERVKLEEKSQQSTANNIQIQQLRTDLDREAVEVAGLEERKLMLKFEAEELERSKEELVRSLDEKRRRQQELLQPTLDKLNSQISELGTEIEQQREYKTREEEARQAFRVKIDECKRRIEGLEQGKLKKRQHFQKIKHDPERMHKQVEHFENTYHNLVTESNKLQTETLATEAQLNELATRRKEFENKRLNIGHKLEMLRSFIQKREARVDELKRILSEENDSTSRMTEQRAELDMEFKQKKHELRNALDQVIANNRLYEDQKKRYERLRRKHDSVREILPPLAEQHSIKTREFEDMKNDARKQGRLLQELKQDVDVFISQYLKQEKSEEDRSGELEEVERRFSDLEEDIKHCLKQEHELEKNIASLSAQRERMARDASKASASFRETREQMKVNELIITDLGKKLGELQQRLKNSSTMYEIIKSQRNKYAHLMQASSQSLAETKEKIKILQNEVEILRSESLSKDRSLAEEVRMGTAAHYARDSLRIEHNRCNNILRDKKEMANRQLLEIDKLNSIINGAEKEMIRIRTNYAHAVEHRNMTGIQLIDRNDELCILHEKFNIQASIIEKGTHEMQNKLTDMRALELEIRDVTWKIEVARKNVPSVDEYTETARRLQQLERELTDQRRLKDELGKKLESPSLDEMQTRCRKLGGDDPDEEQLTAKIDVLQERLNEKKEQLLERALVLDEVGQLADQLRTRAAEGRSVTLELSKAINEYQAKIRNVTHKMMATVSELSMYQATSMKLEQEKIDKESELALANVRLGENLPPTDDSEHELLRLERQRQREQDQLLAHAQAKSDPRLDPVWLNRMVAAMVTRTTAEPRPNAYIPDEVGLPKPYGGAQPFKPSVLGAQLRHFRKPDLKPIEI